MNERTPPVHGKGGGTSEQEPEQEDDKEDSQGGSEAGPIGGGSRSGPSPCPLCTYAVSGEIDREDRKQDGETGHLWRRGASSDEGRADKLAAMVGMTLGPRGRNVILGTSWERPEISNDWGHHRQRHRNPRIATRMMRLECSRRLHRRRTRSPATIPAHALIEGGFKNIAAGASPVDLKRGIDRGVERIVEARTDVRCGAS